MKSPLSHRCLPGSFFVVFLARATSLAVLVSLTRDTELRRPRSDRVWLAGLMFANSWSWLCGSLSLEKSGLFILCQVSMWLHFRRQLGCAHVGITLLDLRMPS